jgi:RNA polymerase sigma-70 factor (ECF subfamily)
MLVSYAADITGQIQTGEEIVQDLFLKIWMQRSELVINGSFRAYLFKAVHNLSLNALRQKNTKKESANTLTPETTWHFIQDTYSTDEDLVEMLFSGETENLIVRAIEELPEQCRRVFLLSRMESMNNSEIALQLAISENTVRAHIYRALKKISAALAEGK